MTVRIVFSAADLARVTLAETPDPLGESLLSLDLLRGGPDGRFDRWCARAPRPELAAFAPVLGHGPSLTADAATVWEAVLARALGARRLRRDADTRPIVARCAIPADTPPTALVAAFAEHFGAAIEPHWEQVEKWILADRDHRGQVLLRDGVGGLLSTLHGSARWAGPVLELSGRSSITVRLAGHGLRLRPSFFLRGGTALLTEPDGPPLLLYPVAREPGRPRPSTPAAGVDRAALAALLGPTRAQVLCAAETGRTTTELGEVAGVSTASASYHASILRQAGLIQTRRTGTAVSHTLTALGTQLLKPTVSAAGVR